MSLCLPYLGFSRFGFDLVGSLGKAAPSSVRVCLCVAHGWGVLVRDYVAMAILSLACTVVVDNVL